MPINDCLGCPSQPINTGFAMGEGPTTAPIMFIGEALGEQEANEGRPFVGGTGKMLRMMIHQAKIPEHSYYITNVVKCRPPGNRTPIPTEIEHCTMRYLRKELACVKPRVIVPVGDVALKTILPECGVGITTARGYSFQKDGAMVIPIVHPSFVARGNPGFWSITVADLTKVRDALNGKLTPPPIERFNINPTLNDVRFLRNLILKERLRFTFDLETVGYKEQLNIMCIGFAWSPSDAMCVPFLKRGGYPYWKDYSEEEQAWGMLCDLFDSDVDMVGQNIFTFDIPKLMEVGVHIRRTNDIGQSRAHDTLIRHHNIATELPHSLEFLTSIYTTIPHYKLDVKRAGGMLWAPDEVMRTYNCRDCVATYIADHHITQEMIEMGLA